MSSLQQQHQTPQKHAAGAPPPQPSQVWDARAILIAKRVRESAGSYTWNQSLGEQGNLSWHARMHVCIRRTMDPPAPSQSGWGQVLFPPAPEEGFRSRLIYFGVSVLKDQAPAWGPRGEKSPASSLPSSRTPGTETRGTDWFVLYKIQYSHSQLSTYSH